MDTIIFLLIFGTLFAMRGERPWLAIGLFFAALTVTLLLFRHHVPWPSCFSRYPL